MQFKITLGILLSLISLSCFSETCGYTPPPKSVEIDKSINARVSIRIEETDCNQAMVSLRIHSTDGKPQKQLYVVDNKLGAFFGARAQNPNKIISQALVDELANEIVVQKIAGNFDIGFKCLNLIPESYINRLKSKNKYMFSYRWRSNEMRYIAYIEEIEQMVVIAQCSKK